MDRNQFTDLLLSFQDNIRPVQYYLIGRLIDHVCNIGNDQLTNALEMYIRDCNDPTISVATCGTRFINRIRGLNGSQYIMNSLNNLLNEF